MKSLFEKPLLPMLLGPLNKRPTPLFVFDGTEVEDMAFIEGLNQALELDIAAGRVDMDTLRDCAIKATVHMIPARRGRSENGVITPAQWSLPGEPWQEVEGGDLRERLLARMVHQGLNPWIDPINSNPDLSQLLGDTLAGTWVSYGYPNLMRMALRMPEVSWDPNQTASKRETHYGVVPNLLQAAVEQDFIDLTDAIINKGAGLTDVLRRAKSPNMVKLLIQAGCSITEIVDEKTNTDVVKHWLSTHSAKTARALVEVAQHQMSPKTRFEQAANGDNWTPLADAMAAWPDWKEATVRAGKLDIRWPLHLLMRSNRGDTERVRQALRLLAKAPVDEREVAPGLSEKALLRLTLARLTVEPIRSKSTANKQLTEQLSNLLSAAGGGVGNDAALDADAKALIAVSEGLVNTGSGRRLAKYLMDSTRVLPQERGQHVREVFPKRTIDDLITMGRVGKLAMRERPRDIGEKGCQTFYGCITSMLKENLAREMDPPRVWIDRLIKQHPDRLDDIATASMGLLGLSMGVHFGYNPGANPDFWKRDCIRMEQLFNNGANPQWSHADCVVFEQAANANLVSPYSKAFAAQLTSYLDRAKLAAVPVTPAATAAAGRHRL